MNKNKDDSSSRNLTLGSLFAGIGGFELGFEVTGRFETLWQVERDEYASRVLAKHWPNVRRHDDVCTWPNETTEPVDVLLAGFPCQDISYAGKGAGLNGKRSGLFYEVMRIVREMGPRFVVLENVSALLTRGMGDVLGTLSSLGFDAEWEIVSAESVGARHRRDRVFVIGWNTNGEHVEAVGGVQKRQVADSGGSGGNLADTSSLRRPGSGVHGRSIDTTESSHWKASDAKSSGERKKRPWHFEPSVGGVADGFSLWLDEPRIGRTSVGMVKRADRLRCLGNAIVPQVAKVVAERVLELEAKTLGDQGTRGV